MPGRGITASVTGKIETFNFQIFERDDDKKILSSHSAQIMIVDADYEILEHHRLMYGDELLFENGLSRSTLSSSLRKKDPAIVNLANDLLRRAEPFYRNGHKVLFELNDLLGFSEKTALNKLIGVYDQLYSLAQENVQILIEQGQGLEEKFRI